MPDGWSKVPPDRATTKAMLLLDGTRWDSVKGMIKVDVGSPAFPTAQAIAESFARGADGQVAQDEVDVDGEKGVRVTTASTDLSKPRSMIVVYRDGKAYLIMGGAVEGVDVGDAVDRICTTWKWST
jgi:hypothetical protein